MREGLSVLQKLDASGEVGRHTYFPFGEEITDSGQNGEEMKFTGHERDLGSSGNGDDLDYMHARYCSPTTGRFLSVDPKNRRQRGGRFPQIYNRYSYTANNPMKFIDPDGLDLTIFFRFSDERAWRSNWRTTTWTRTPAW